MRLVKTAKSILLSAERAITTAIKKLEELESKSENNKSSDSNGRIDTTSNTQTGESKTSFSDKIPHYIGDSPPIPKSPSPDNKPDTSPELSDPYVVAEILWNYGAFLLLEGAPRSRTDGLWQARKLLLKEPELWPESSRHLEQFEIHEKAIQILLALADGTLPDEYIKLREKWGPAGAELLKVRGIGPYLAKKIWEELGISSLRELERAIEDRSLLKVKGIGPKLLQQIGEELREAKNRWAILEEKHRQFLRERGSSSLAAAKYRKLIREDFLPDSFSERETFLDLLPLDWAPPSPIQKLMETSLYSRFYEELFRPYLTRLVTSRPVKEEIHLNVELLSLKPDFTVLDVACGTGNYTRAIAENLDLSKGMAIGLDSSRPMLSRAIEKAGELKNIKFVRGDVHSLPFRNSSFDALHCAGAFHLFSEPPTALREFYRVLKGGGRLVLSTFILSSNPLIRSLQRFSAPFSGFYWFELERLLELMAAVNFRVVKVSIDGLAVSIAADKVE